MLLLAGEKTLDHRRMRWGHFDGAAKHDRRRLSLLPAKVVATTVHSHYFPAAGYAKARGCAFVGLEFRHDLTRSLFTFDY